MIKCKISRKSSSSFIHKTVVLSNNYWSSNPFLHCLAEYIFMNTLAFTFFSSDTGSSHDSNSSWPLKSEALFFLLMFSHLHRLPFWQSFSSQPSNLNWLVTALVIYHYVTYCHKTQGFKITINFYHRTVSAGQRLQPSGAKGRGKPPPLCRSKRGNAGAGWEPLAHSSSEIQWDTGNSWVGFKAWFSP